MSAVPMVAPVAAAPNSTGTPASLGGFAASTSSALTARHTAGGPAVRRAYCRGRRATIVGNAHDNRIVGTRHRDVIAAGRGADIIIGRGGHDIICGGRGADVINGGPGRDKIFGDAGGDIVEGGRGRDRLYGGTRKDLCSGEAREHRYHFGCEVHRDPFGNVVTPPPTDSPRVAARRVSDPQPTGVYRSSARRVGGYLAVQSPADCVRSYSSRFIRLGTVQFQTYYTDPGEIALRPLYASYQNGWATDLTAARDWAYYTAPADGQIYQVDMGTSDLPSTNTGTIWGWEAYWWNGTAWDNHTTVEYGSYNWVGYLGAVSAPNSVVCA